MLTNLRAALHTIADEIERCNFASATTKLRAILDAPPTVAELIGQAVNGKAVEWVHVDLDTAETTAMRAEWEGMSLCVSFYADDGTFCEGDADLMPCDLTQPARLVEATP